ncbi:MAG: uracil-DNA glycosylase [Flavobacterium sp. BFFFF2]|nr:MAG: uracil-DNA glycosylase [Flavobacterium sp. BFFFF2]
MNKLFSALEPSWQQALSKELESPKYEQLAAFVQQEYEQNSCYPPKNQIFAAFDLCLIDDVKVVILGQDPYHGAGQAHGLCFSVNDSQAFPPSLKNILKELKQDLGIPIPNSGNLTRWAKQGVLLLNATLTVREGQAGSHQKQGWEDFTDAVIQQLNQSKHPIVFMLWGGFAQKKGKVIDQIKHLILNAGHPSPLSANRGFWFGNQHFSRCNLFLEEQYNRKIDW